MVKTNILKAIFLCATLVALIDARRKFHKLSELMTLDDYGQVVKELPPVDFHPPGIAMRIQEKTIKNMMKAFQRFLPHYLTYDLDTHMLD